ncbi:hypothetical protein E2562_011388 [Oryza meyeriana var. granulata]|uniref:SUI1 domain-containing protein n=1 Tax=Oryza meyeriana var. granulata TaxID=110450 RepID=A0A6G1EAE8_9ORYZ|nr:hypothetical protein E2562_011388 [Oryza meyeriana var. granulata]KAF0921641.1 hypothetical protein E2562_011388 [Oryza meyeriana var. granulata]
MILPVHLGPVRAPGHRAAGLVELNGGASGGDCYAIIVLQGAGFEVAFLAGGLNGRKCNAERIENSVKENKGDDTLDASWDITVICKVQNFEEVTDPFAEANAKNSNTGPGAKDYVHVCIQQCNGRKSLTTVQGLKEFSYNKILNGLKKEFCCNGTVVQDLELGQVIQLQGGQYKNVDIQLGGIHFASGGGD